METTQNETPQQVTQDPLFRVRCVKFIAFLWALLIILVAIKIGMDETGILAQLGIYLGVAALLTGALGSLDKLFDKESTRQKDNPICRIINIIYILMIINPIFGIYANIKSLRTTQATDPATFAHAVAAIRDSTDRRIRRMDPADLLRKDGWAGEQIKKYQEAAVDSTITVWGIPFYRKSGFKSRLDSALGDPAQRIRRWADNYEDMLRDISKLIEDQNIAGIEPVLKRHGISLEARAIEVSGTLKISHGLLKDFLLAEIQRIQPLFSYIEPDFGMGDEPIRELRFIFPNS